ncbi:peptidylprolyl isomerase PrsA [Streptococcus massiliensis]|nr:peptidylprolyl isomerase PrsA [Streptococcus massiliensis]
MKKKIMTGAVTLLSVAVLAACSQNSKDIVTMKGDTITVDEFYNQVKNSSAAQEVLLSMTINNVFEKKYGKNVSEKEVNEVYEKSAKTYGDAFSSVLARSGLTTETYKAQIRTNKLVEYAVKKAAEKELNDDAYKAAYETYTPEVTAQIIKLSDEATAKSVAEKAKNGEDFTQLAKDNSTDKNTKDKGGETKFDSASTDVPDDVKKAAFGLEVNGISDVITVKASNSSTASYYVVKLTKKTDKSAKWQDYKKRLKEIIVAQKQSNRSYIQKVISKELSEANIKVKDQAFQNLFTQYIGSTGTSSSTSTSGSSSSSGSSSK